MWMGCRRCSSWSDGWLCSWRGHRGWPRRRGRNSGRLSLRRADGEVDAALFGLLVIRCIPDPIDGVDPVAYACVQRAGQGFAIEVVQIELAISHLLPGGVRYSEAALLLAQFLVEHKRNLRRWRI